MRATATTVRVYFPVIDVLRFLSALAVALYHLGFTSWASPRSNVARLVGGEYQIPEGTAFFWGNVGVPIFFVISGFVIAGSANGASPASFVRSRFERLYPAAWICATVTAGVWIAVRYYPWHELELRYLRTLLLSPRGALIDGQYWTLRVEIGFYACIFGLIAANRVRWFPIFACVLVACGALTAGIEIAQACRVLPAGTMNHLVGRNLRILPIYYGAFFGLGMLLWLRQSGLAGTLWRAFIALAAAAGAALIASDALKEARANPTIGAWFYLTIALWLGAVVLIAIGRPLRLDAAGLKRAHVRLMRLGGLATYPFYLLHFGFGVWLIRSLVAAGTPPFAALGMTMAVLLISSLLIAGVAEPAIRRALRSLFSGTGAFLPEWALQRTSAWGRSD